MTTIKVPELSLVVLVGVSGSGKSTFAARHFRPTEVLSSDVFRGLVGDDENDQSVTNEAFEALHVVAAKRLAIGRLTVIDATNVQPETAQPLVELAREQHVLPVAIVLDVREKICHRAERGPGRPHVRRRTSSPASTRRSRARSGGWTGRASAACSCCAARPRSMPRSLSSASGPGPTARTTSGPFDIIGDVHGCHASWLTCWTASATGEAGRGREPATHPGRPHGGVPRRPGRPRPGHAGRAAHGDGDGRGRHRALRARQPRDASCCGRCAGATSQVSHGLAESLAQLGAPSRKDSGTG